MNKVKNYARFYALFRQIPVADEELKQSYVHSFTNGRTTSLKEMMPEEYNQMCDRLQAVITGKPANEYQAELKKLRSGVLKRLQEGGVDTTNWAAVDAYCMNPRIAGKPFGKLTTEELKNLQKRLIMIRQKNQNKGEFNLSPKMEARLLQAMSNQMPN